MSSDRSYAALHLHSEYSALDSTARIADIVSRAIELGLPAIGLSDHGHLFGAYEFYTECQRQGVKPIIGMEAYVAPGDATARERVEWGRLEDKISPSAYTHLSLIAASATGLRNLYRLHRESYTAGFYHKARCDRGMLAKNAEGVIVLSGCAGSELSTRIRLGHTSEAREYASTMKEIFGDRFFIECMDHGIDFEKELNRGLQEVAEEVGIDIVASCDSHYTNEGDSAIHDAFLCLSTYAKISDEKRYRFNGSGYHLRSRAEMDRLVLPPRAITNTLRVAEMVESYDPVFTPQRRMPTAIIPEGWEYVDYGGPVSTAASV